MANQATLAQELFLQTDPGQVFLDHPDSELADQVYIGRANKIHANVFDQDSYSQHLCIASENSQTVPKDLLDEPSTPNKKNWGHLTDNAIGVAKNIGVYSAFAEIQRFRDDPVLFDSPHAFISCAPRCN